MQSAFKLAWKNRRVGGKCGLKKIVFLIKYLLLFWHRNRFLPEFEDKRTE
jgi:hypothetical protein